MNEVRSSTDTINLHPCGDKELWYAQGEDWAIPFLVLFYEDRVNARHFAFLEPCFSPYTSQLVLLTKLFEAHDHLGKNNPWLILKGTCEALLTKAPGVTPARYYKWPDCKLRPVPAWNPLQYATETPAPKTIGGGQRDFVKYVSESSGIQSSIVAAVLGAVADAGPKWMLEEGRAIDFGFCKIMTAPFRANWKEIVTFKLGARKLLSIFSGYRNGELTQELDKAGLPEVLASPHNIGLRDRRIDYVMEAWPTTKFEKFVDEFSRKIYRNGLASHVQHYEQMVESLYEDLVTALRCYIKKISTPFAQISNRFSAGILSLLPARRQKFKSARLPLADLPQRIIPTASRFSVFSEQDKLSLVLSPIAALPEVSTVSSTTNDVWERSIAANVECFPERDDAPGAIGVSVLHAGEGNASGQPMLAGPEAGAGNASGLDGKGNL